MPLGERYIPPYPVKLTAEELELRPRAVMVPGARMDMSAHPTDFKYSDSEARDEGGRWTTGGGGGKKPSSEPVMVAAGDKPGSRGILKPKEPSEENFKVAGAIAYTTVYHGTVVAVQEKIQKNGILPSKKGKRIFHSSYYTGDRGESVFVTNDIKQAEYWASEAKRYAIGKEEKKLDQEHMTSEQMNAWYKEMDSKIKILIVECEVPASSLLADDTNIANKEKHFMIKGGIKPENIKKYHTKKYSDNIVFVPILINEKVKA